MPEPLEPAKLALDPDSEIPALLDLCPGIAPLRYRDGEKLVVEGETTQEVFLVLKGSLVVEHREQDGAQRPLAHLECGPEHPCIVGEMAYFGAQRRTATVRAVGACQALRLRPADLDTIMEGFPALTRLVCQQFTKRLQEANDTLRDLRARFDLGAERRLAEPGELLFRAGERSPLFQLAMGTVRLEGPEGARIVGPRDLPEGFLGLEPYLRDQPHPCTAAIEETCLLAVVPPARREAFLRAQPGLVLRLLEGKL
ncbi:MAG TPA: cyclic nucleotide-binding domain-containing protein [Holophagaceae bacterium]